MRNIYGCNGLRTFRKAKRRRKTLKNGHFSISYPMTTGGVVSDAKGSIRAKNAGSTYNPTTPNPIKILPKSIK